MYIFPFIRIRYIKTITINTHIDCLKNSKCSVRDILLATKQGAFERVFGTFSVITGLFEEHFARLRCHNVSTRDTLIVLANKLAGKTLHGNYEPFHNQKIFWENCGEDDIKFP